MSHTNIDSVTSHNAEAWMFNPMKHKETRLGHAICQISERCHQILRIGPLKKFAWEPQPLSTADLWCWGMIAGPSIRFLHLMQKGAVISLEKCRSLLVCYISFCCRNTCTGSWIVEEYNPMKQWNWLWPFKLWTRSQPRSFEYYKDAVILMHTLTLHCILWVANNNHRPCLMCGGRATMVHSNDNRKSTQSEK